MRKKSKCVENILRKLEITRKIKKKKELAFIYVNISNHYVQDLYIS